MKSLSLFKIVVVGVFILCAVVGVLLFAGLGGGNNKSTPTVTIWGTLPGVHVNDLVHSLNQSSTVLNVTYTEMSPEEFLRNFPNAIANGKGPDMVLVPDDLLYQERNKLLPIGYKTYPERDFRNTFIDAATLFLTADGSLGIPFAVDPMVMYWNKDIFSSAGVPRPPELWSQLPSIGGRIIQKTDTSSITRALVPFGAYQNVTNAKGILATLIFQAGSSLTGINDTGEYYSTLNDGGNQSTSPAETAVSFYTSFSDPVKPLYTWNRSLPQSRDDFLGGNLSMYFGFASELKPLRGMNPNLNFDVAVMPQADNAPKAVYGHIYALSIVKSNSNVTSALTAAGLLTSVTSMSTWTTLTGLPPVRRDLLSVRPTDPYLDVFYTAAVQAKTWMDPDPTQTDRLFQNMVESVTTGTGRGSDQVTTVKQQIDQLLKDNQ